MPKTATPRKPETVSRKLAETRATSKNRSLSSLLGIGDSEKRLATDFGSGLNDVIGRGTIAGLLGLPGDLGGAAENGLRSLLGLPQVVPYGGSEHIGQKMEEAGLVSNVRRPKTELLASLISPAQAATAGYKAPQMARAGVKALDNLSAPRTMGRQQGAIENLWHGTPHNYPAERLVRMPDGSEQYLVGGVESLPPVPQGATPIRDFPLGRQRLDKIGTGEGAQAYGHGIYQAEAQDVAESYKQSLGRNPDELKRIAQNHGMSDDAAQLLTEQFTNGFGGNRFDDWLNNLEGVVDYPFADEKTRTAAKEILDRSVEASDAYGKMRAPGNLYQTRLAWPDPAREATDPLSPDHFLHWDKPLAEQPQAVQDRLRPFLSQFDTVEDGERYAYVDDYDYMDEIYHKLSGKYIGDDVASAELAKQGIPGIRYLDGGSRGAGAGSHNYVVFDDKLIDIVSRNGQPVGNLGKMVAPQDELAQNMAKARQMLEDGTPVAVKDAWYNSLTPDMRFKMAAESGIALPEERAAAMGFDTPQTHYSRSDKPFDEFALKTASKDTSFLDGLGVHMGTEQAALDRFNSYWKGDPREPTGFTMPLLVKSSDPLLKSNGGIYTEPELRAFLAKKAESAGMKNPKDSRDTQLKIRDALAGKYTNVPYVNKIEGGGEVSYIVPGPRNIRSRFAAFDPMRRDSSDLLAGLAPFGAVPWLQEDK